MEIFKASNISTNKHIIGEIEGTERGKLYEVVDESSVELNKPCQNKRCSNYALRIYYIDPNLTISKTGISPNLLKQTQIINFQHPSLLKLHDIDVVTTDSNQNYLLLLLELASGNLYDWMKYVKNEIDEKRSTIEDFLDNIIKYAYQILQGLSYLHENQFIHRKLTPSNIMMTEIDSSSMSSSKILEAKIGDFHDLVMLTNNNKFQNNNKPIFCEKDCTYMAPEILAGYNKHQNSADIWSFGIILYEMLFGYKKYPFFHKEEEEEEEEENKDENIFPKIQKLIKKIFKWIGIPNMFVREEYYDNNNNNNNNIFEETNDEKSEDENLDDKKLFFKKIKNEKKNSLKFSMLIDLIDLCLRINPDERITAKEALKHSIFSSFIYDDPTNHQTLEEKLIMKKIKKNDENDPTLIEIREDIIKTTHKDIQKGYLNFYAILLAFYIFDCLMFQPKTNFFLFIKQKISNLHKAIYQFFCACYIISIKIITNDVQEKDNVFDKIQGLICTTNTDQDRLRILQFEQIIIMELRFRFNTFEILKIPITDKIFDTFHKYHFSQN